MSDLSSEAAGRAYAGSLQPATRAIVEGVHAAPIVDRLVELALSGGTVLEPTPDQPNHIATNRVALSKEDVSARRSLVEPWMRDAGMEVTEHPMGLIGTYAGRKEDLAPIVIMSHTDTVPDGDMYDGTLGVIGGIEVVRTMNRQGFTPKRGVMVLALTGEESAAFGCALFGSRALFQGLNDRELAASNKQGLSIGDALGPVDSEIARRPVFGPKGTLLPAPKSVVELHVEQDEKLERAGIDIGVVNAIAAPERYRATVGLASLEPDRTVYDHESYYLLSVEGKTDHSGATPMGLEHRADGLLETADFLDRLLDRRPTQGVLTVGEIEVENGAINKVPGITRARLRLGSNDAGELDRAHELLARSIKEHNMNLNLVATRFDRDPLSLEKIKKSSAGTFFEIGEITRRHKAAFQLIDTVNLSAQLNSGSKVVGTVGTYRMTADGKISLEVDIRGIQKESRTETIGRVRELTAETTDGLVNLGEPLAGSGDPVVMDETLVAKAHSAIEAYGVGSAQTMFSAAGHDAQNAARAGIPTVMLFAQSHNGGLAHHPDAYTRPDSIQTGVRALAALVMALANE